jgi:hypothetical protein
MNRVPSVTNHSAKKEDDRGRMGETSHPIITNRTSPTVDSDVRWSGIRKFEERSICLGFPEIIQCNVT